MKDFRKVKFAKWMAHPESEEGRVRETPGTGILPIINSITSDLW